MTHELLIHVATWNVADQGPPPVGRLQLNKLLQLDSSVPADVCAIGLQEVRKSSDWGAQLTKEAARCDYVLVRSIQMQGIVLYTYVLRKHLPFVTNVETQYTRTALNGLLGLKGAVSFRADLYGVNIAIVNCHLCAYDEKFAERIENYNVIIEGQTFKDKYVENILDHDYVFWIGDLNFRIDDLTRDEIIERTEKRDYQTLLLNDQLCKARKEELIFVDFEEGPISFPPTYKFDIGCNTYDSGPKCRKPAWCDRILYMVHEDAFMELSTLQLLTTHGCIDPRLHVQQLVYTSIMDFQTSDHKPVVSQFIIKAFTVAPTVVFDDPHDWQCGNEATVRYHVIGMPTSTWDYIALFKADFFTLDEYVTYVYAAAKKDSAAGATVSVHTAKFPAAALRDPGPHRLCYISAGKKFIRGMSNVFEVQPKYVLAPLLPEDVLKAAIEEQQPLPPSTIAEDTTVTAAVGVDVTDVFADASLPPAVEEFPARAWVPPDGVALPAALLDPAAGQSDGPKTSAAVGGAVALSPAAGVGGSSSRLHPGMSIQELKLVSAELRQEQRRKQSAMSLLLAKASKLSARLAGSILPLSSPAQIAEEEGLCAAALLPSAVPAAAIAEAVAKPAASHCPPSAQPSSVAALGNPAVVVAAEQEQTAPKEEGAGRGFTDASLLYSSDTASYVTALDLESLATTQSKGWQMASDRSDGLMISDVVAPTAASPSVAGPTVAAPAPADGLRSTDTVDGTANTRCADTAVSNSPRAAVADSPRRASGAAASLQCPAGLADGAGLPDVHDVGGNCSASTVQPQRVERTGGSGKAPRVLLPATTVTGIAGQSGRSAASPWRSQESAGAISADGSNDSSGSSCTSSVSPPSPDTTAKKGT